MSTYAAMNTSLALGIGCFVIAGWAVCLAGFLYVWRWTVKFEAKVDALAQGLQAVKEQGNQNTNALAALDVRLQTHDLQIENLRANAADFENKLELLVTKLTEALGISVVNEPPQNFAVSRRASVAPRGARKRASQGRILRKPQATQRN